jgi:hypothetical protein
VIPAPKGNVFWGFCSLPWADVFRATRIVYIVAIYDLPDTELLTNRAVWCDTFDENGNKIEAKKSVKRKPAAPTDVYAPRRMVCMQKHEWFSVLVCMKNIYYTCVTYSNVIQTVAHTKVAKQRPPLLANVVSRYL